MQEGIKNKRKKIQKGSISIDPFSIYTGYTNYIHTSIIIQTYRSCFSTYSRLYPFQPVHNVFPNTDYIRTLLIKLRNTLCKAFKCIYRYIKKHEVNYPTPNHILFTRRVFWRACYIPAYPDVQVARIKRNQVVNLRYFHLTHTTLFLLTRVSSLLVFL